ncbi:DUF637 domain-containing protein [Serratia plymuthica]|uniref:DUF637 domain-containing protein n=1 Tax=Serratia plymuthica TaxID=82996 RepID=UPI002DBF42AB|nr:DUF637 domain-containing protein [Serratia plymuthica]MEB6539391.1 DUF637 domain-containing protein [Serratia plymuthica]
MDKLNHPLPRSISYLLIYLTALQPLHPAFAAGINAANGNTQVVIKPGNVPVVNIAMPNGAGISHNTYKDFNVGAPGAVLNNATQGGKTQLGVDIINGNPNLKGKPADLIINEVTGGSRSELQGKLEVFGNKANVMIANPNGISCDGCGFINAPGVTLTTGKPQFDKQGALEALEVKKGGVTIGGKGLDGNSADYVDIISRATELNGKINANNLSLTLGANRVSFKDGTIKPIAGEGAKPVLAVDTKALGGMYANKIRLVANEDGVGVNLNNINSTQRDVTLTVNGRIELGQAHAQTDLNVSAREVHIASGVKVRGERDVTLAADTLNNNGNVTAHRDMRVFADKVRNVELRDGDNTALHSNNTLWIQKDAQGNKATSVENRSAKILTNSGDLVIRTESLNNVRNEMSAGWRNIPGDSKAFNKSSVGSYYDTRQGVDAVVRLEPELKDFGIGSWFGEINLSKNDKVNVGRDDYVITKSQVPGVISSGSNAYINATSLWNDQSNINAAKDLILTGKDFIVKSLQLGQKDLYWQLGSSTFGVGSIARDEDAPPGDWDLLNVTEKAAYTRQQELLAWKDKGHQKSSITAGNNLTADFNGGIHIDTPLPYDVKTSEAVVSTRPDTLVAKNILLHANTIGNTDAIRASGDITLIAEDRINLGQGVLNAGNNVSMTAVNNIDAWQSEVKGKNVTLLTKNGEIKFHTSQGPHYFQPDGSHWMGGLEASGDLTLNAGSTITLLNTRLAPQSRNIAMTANGSITLDRDFSWLWYKPFSPAISPTPAKELALFNQMLAVGQMSASGSVLLNTGGYLALRGAQIKAAKDITLLAGHNADLNYRGLNERVNYLFHSNRTPELGSKVHAGGNLLINSARDLGTQGGTLSANGNITLLAGQNLWLAAAGYSAIDAVNDNNKDDRHLVTTLNAGKNFTAAANNQLLTYGTKLTSGGNMTLTSGGDMRFEAVQNHTYREGNKEFTETRTQQGTELNAGGLMTVISGGSILFQATKLVTKGALGLVSTPADLSSIDAVLATAELQAQQFRQRYEQAQQNRGNAEGQLNERRRELEAARHHPDTLSLFDVVAHPITSSSVRFVAVPIYSGGGAYLDVSAHIDNQAHLDHLLREGGLAFVNNVLQWGETSAPTPEGTKVGNAFKDATVAEYDKIRQRLIDRRNAVNNALNAVNVAQSVFEQAQQQVMQPAREKEDAENRLNTVRSERQRQYDAERQRKGQEDANNRELAVRTGTLDIAAKGGYLYAQAMEESSHYEKTEKKRKWWGKKTEVKQTRHDVTNKVTEFTAAGNINLMSRDDSTYEASKIAAGQNARLTSTYGQVNFRAVKNTSFEQTISNSKGFFIKQSNKGYEDNKWVLPSIHTGGTLTVDAAKGVSADVKAKNGQALQSAIDALGNTSGTTWVKDLNKRNDVQWNIVKDAYDSWDYKSQHLNPAVAAVIAIAAAAVTAGSSLTALAASNVAGAIGGGAVTSGAVTAGMSSLASQAAVALVENQGNLSKTLKVLGSNESVKATATAMAIGGALNGFDSAMGWSKDAAGKPLNPNNVKLPQLSNGDWSKVAQRVAGQSVISSSLNTAINGGSFKDNLTNALLANIGSQINAEGAKLIGDNGEVLGVVGKSVSHAVVAGVAAEIGRGDGKGAAAGALAAELAGVIMQSTLFEPANLNEKERQLYRLQEALNGNEVKEQTARVIGALTGALTTHTPEGAYSAADSAQSVYRYNMTEHMLMQYALDNQKDILAADKGDVAAAKRVVARREAAAIVATVGGGGLVLAAGGMTLVGAAPELVLAARLAIAGCKTNPALCLNQAGIYAADIVAPEAIIGTGAVTTGSTLILGKTEESVKKLTQQLVKTSDELYKTKNFNAQPVADFIKGETAAGTNLSTKTADYLRGVQKTNTDQLVKVFDPKQNDSKLNVFGQQFAQVLGEGGSNKSGTTKVFATEKLSKQEIIDYAQSLAGTVPLEEIKTPKGMVYFAKKDGVTINLREYSSSDEKTKARWTIDIVGKSSVGDTVGQNIKKVEIKFR